MSILKDGWKQAKDATTDVISRASIKIHGGYCDLPATMAAALREVAWISNAEVRLYEHGHLIFGGAFVETNNKAEVSAAALDHASKTGRAVDWRWKKLMVTLEERVD